MTVRNLDPRFQPAVNDMSSPMLRKEERKEAQVYGYSFNSKQVAQGPTFFNLRIMCSCLGKAIRRHIDFSKNDNWFLDELTEMKARLADANRKEKEGSGSDEQEDDEMVQQILNTFFKFLFFAPTRDIVLRQIQMVSIVLELLSDKNPNIKGLVNAILDYV